MVLRVIALSLCLLLILASGSEAGAPKFSLVDGGGLEQGFAKVSLGSGSVKANFLLPALPAMADSDGDPFEATIYRAYLTNSLDDAVEVSLGGIYPNAKGKAKLKAALKGDLSRLGLDRLIVVAFSKDGLRSFDVLTGTIETP